MSLSVKDLAKYFIALSVFVIFNLSFTFIPWKVFFLFVGAVSLVGLYAYFDLGSSMGGLVSGSKDSLNVEPVDAPKKLNEKVKQKEMYKPLDLEKTGKASTKVHVDTQHVRVDGDNTNLMYGIIAMPKNPWKREYIAYIYDLNEDRIRKYDSQRYDSGAKIQPFEGKYSWLTARGLERQVVDDGTTGEGRVVINQNPKKDIADREDLRGEEQ